MKYEIENLLRPPVELASSIVSFSFLGLCVANPAVLSIPPSIGLGFASFFAITGIRRLKQGCDILKYQKNLKNLPHYEMSLSSMKKSDNYLFMGRGFKWNEVHTERIYSARERRNVCYTEVSKFYEAIRTFEYNNENNWLRYIAKLTSINHPLNPVRPYPDVGGNPILHGVGTIDEKNIRMRLSNRYGHHIVCGSTRVGKSRKAEIYITQDIHRNKDDLIVIFDPKGDPELLRRVYVEAMRAGRLSELSIFHLGFPEISCTYNPLDSFTRITELSTRVTGNLPEDGNSKTFKDFAWQFTNVFAKGLFYCGEIPDYSKIKRAFKSPESVFIKYAHKYFERNNISSKLEIEAIESRLNSGRRSKKGQSIKSEAICIFIEENEIYDMSLDDLRHVACLDSEYFSKISSAISPFLEKVTSGKVGDILSGVSSSDKSKPVLDWMDAYKRGGIVYVGLDALTDVEVGGAVGEASFAALTSMAGFIYKHDVNAGTPFNKKIKKNVIIHGDEFSDLIGQKFVPLANKSGGANFQLVLYTQTMSDIEVKLGTESKANQVMTNINTIEFMRVQDEKTANLMINKLPEVNVSLVMAVSGVNDNAGQGGTIGFVSSNEDRTSTQRVKTIQVADIAGLPKGQSFCLMDGNQLYKLRAPMPSKKDTEKLPSDIIKVLTKMKDSYKSNVEWGALKNDI